MIKLTKLAAGLALATCALASTSAFAQMSYNVGVASEYYYRGILQKESSAFAGADFTQGSFYAGTWAADVGDGLEVDGYGGFTFASESGFNGKIGVTGYYYTGDFDDTYEEINLGLGYKILSVEYSTGTWDGFGAEQDYDFFAATIASNGFYGKYGTFGKDFDGDYFEAGYGFKVADEIDVTIAAIFNDETLSKTTSSDEALVLTLKKVF